MSETNDTSNEEADVMNRRTEQASAPPSTVAPIQGAGHEPPAEPIATPLRSPALSAAAVTLTAVSAALAVWVFAVPVAGVTLTAGGLTVSLTAVALVSLGSGCAASLSYLIMRGFRGGAVMWTVIACAVLVLSLAGPLLSGARDSALVTLELMHLAVGVTMIVGLRRFVSRSMSRAFDHDVAATDSASSAAGSE
ncbi:DUF6069 family protein [Brevibacterium sp. K11IcPPYGO002]|uniref:DUF6069 family protein n=1 Tax=Brevibacterium sp. K11IcPPYGO002 TaxID=3058837 RepID=UPI003D813D5F